MKKPLIRKIMSITIKVTMILQGLTLPTFGQNLIPDSLFATNSSVQTSLGTGDESSKLLFQPDGKILFGGYDYDGSCNCFRNTMIRVDVCGSIDSTFGVNGKVVHAFSQRNIGNDYALQPDGKIVVAGMQAPSNSGSQQIPFVGRYNADGSVDNTFATGGTNSLRFDPVSSGRFFSTSVMDDGRILCVGISATNINGGVSGIGAMRFLANGNVDPTFSGDGITRLPTFGNKAFFGNFSGNLLKDGRIICIGTTTLNATFTNQMAAAAFDSTGAIDITFGASGYFEDPEVTAGNRVFGAIQSDEKIIFGADLLGNSSVVIKRLTNLGAIDLSFGSSGSITLAYANGFGTLKGIKILSNDKILLFINNLTAATYTLHQLTRDGVTDTSFGINGVVTIFYGGSGQQYFNRAIEYPNGDLVVSGVRNSDIVISRLTENSNVPRLTNVCASLNSNVNNPGITHQWFVDGTAIPLANASTHTATQNGSYTVEITDSNGCTIKSNSILLNTDGPTITSNSRCGSGSLTLSASGGSNGQYRWYDVPTGGFEIPGEVNSTFITPTINNTTTYYVSILTGLCESKRTPVTATISFLAKPILTSSKLITNGIVDLCAGDSLLLSAPANFTSYSWSNGFSSRQIAIYQSGKFAVSVEDASGCNSAPSDTVTVNLKPNQQAIITSDDTELSASTGDAYQWFLFDNPIIGATAQSLQLNVLEYGEYSVAVINNVCTSISENFIYLITELEMFDSEIKIYPNPTTTKLFIDLTKPADKITMVDPIGRQWYEASADKGLHVIDVSSLAKGIHYLQIKSTDKVMVFKIQIL